MLLKKNLEKSHIWFLPDANENKWGANEDCYLSLLLFDLGYSELKLKPWKTYSLLEIKYTLTEIN